MRRCRLKSDTLRLIKSCHDKIHAFASKCSHFLSSTSTASTSASEVKLVLGPLRLILGHFDTRIIVKPNLNHLMTLSETASDDLKTASEVTLYRKSYFLQSEAIKFTLICHSMSKSIILAWKFVLVESSKIFLNLRKIYIWGCWGCVM